MSESMKTHTGTASVPQDTKVDCSAVSDRGLNDRRPINEDSYLVDGERRIFAVADGVGGAEAGEVADDGSED